MKMIFKKYASPDSRLAYLMLSMIICVLAQAANIISGYMDLPLAGCAFLALLPPLMFLLSPLWGRLRTRNIYVGISVLHAIGMLALVLTGICCAQRMADLVKIIIASAVCLSAIALYLGGQLARIRNVRVLLNECTVWQNLRGVAEAVYVMATILLSMLLVLALFMRGGARLALILPLLLLSLLTVAALSWRICTDSVFVLLHKRESEILENLRVSQIEVAHGAKPDSYRELYDRIVEFFEKEKPYLNNALTMNDVVQVVFSNKTYISRVISVYTGRNFCQFVNYYRVAHAMAAFRENPHLKVNEMALCSGFNSVVTFSTAFRLFANENPSEWCRRERAKLLKKK